MLGRRHAHSGGVEATVASGGVGDIGRLARSGAVNAAFPAAACHAFAADGWRDVDGLNEELDARIPLSVLRAASGWRTSTAATAHRVC